MSEKYSLNRAQEEAHKMTTKIMSKVALDYKDAETQVEKEEDKKEIRVAVHFDRRHFGAEEKLMGTRELVGDFNAWWNKICTDNNLDLGDKKLDRISYHILELAKNVLECTFGGGEIEIIFEKNKITTMITDQGQGFEDPNEDILNNPHHGLYATKAYADEFTIETNGKKFTKVPKKRRLVMSLDTDVTHGSRITMVKKY